VFLRSRITRIDSEHGLEIEGMQVEVDPNIGKHAGGLYESGGHHAHRSWRKSLQTRPVERLEIFTRGNHIVTKLNGVQIVAFTDPPRFVDGVVGLQIRTDGGVKMRKKDNASERNKQNFSGSS
jgi:hypothetical protein